MEVINLGGVQVAIDDRTVQWNAGLAIDADGSPRAYALPGARGPDGRKLAPLDAIGNAGRPAEGKWWGVDVDANGKPIVQPSGYLVSTTALYDKKMRRGNPARYVDAESVPYVVIPPELLHFNGAPLLRMGDVAIVAYRDELCEAILADVGPHNKVGEGSIALAKRLKINASPRHGGTGSGVAVVVYRGSSKGWPRSAKSIVDQVAQLRVAEVF